MLRREPTRLEIRQSDIDALDDVNKRILRHAVLKEIREHALAPNDSLLLSHPDGATSPAAVAGPLTMLRRRATARDEPLSGAPPARNSLPRADFDAGGLQGEPAPARDESSLFGASDDVSSLFSTPSAATRASHSYLDTSMSSLGPTPSPSDSSMMRMSLPDLSGYITPPSPSNDYLLTPPQSEMQRRRGTPGTGTRYEFGSESGAEARRVSASPSAPDSDADSMSRLDPTLLAEVLRDTHDGDGAAALERLRLLRLQAEAGVGATDIAPDAPIASFPQTVAEATPDFSRTPHDVIASRTRRAIARARAASRAASAGAGTGAGAAAAAIPVAGALEPDLGSWDPLARLVTTGSASSAAGTGASGRDESMVDE